ncbi:hypothetical protein [Burkholderia sp. Ax-1724]|uniref:hypothetical protein n=1 Tax=Burkholderia sp. Ax-1724 TaxID=2608336 RepID=UPI001422213D|nr:hypothetical protein [Burkholderia sp. Ax-1724]
MRVGQLMDALRQFNTDAEVAVRTHSDFRQVKFLERSDGGMALIDIRFSDRIDDERDDD